MILDSVFSHFSKYRATSCQMDPSAQVPDLYFCLGHGLMYFLESASFSWASFANLNRLVSSISLSQASRAPTFFLFTSWSYSFSAGLSPLLSCSMAPVRTRRWPGEPVRPVHKYRRSHWRCLLLSCLAWICLWSGQKLVCSTFEPQIQTGAWCAFLVLLLGGWGMPASGVNFGCQLRISNCDCCIPSH